MKGKAARVGSSEPQALFIMIFKDFFLGCSDCDARPSSGTENSCARKRRRAILFSPTAWISKEMIAANCTLFLHDVHGFFFSSRRRHTRCYRDWSSDVCSSDLGPDLSAIGT